MPEGVPDIIQGTAIVIIQPGSLNLRIGRAADAYPHTIMHCIARRHKQPAQRRYEDRWLVRPEYMHSESRMQQKAGLKLAEEAIQYRPTSAGQYRQPTSHKQILPLNAHSKAEVTHFPSGVQWTDTQHNPEFLVGDKAFYTNPKDPYSLHWPMRRGRLNLHDGVGGSLTAIVQDLVDIWAYALENQLDIPIKDLMHYRAVLLVPDMYERAHVREMIAVLLDQLGFGAAFAVQESVCATFGSGVPSACVIDVGDQKTSVCCVEDGLSHKQTRLFMEYGGADLTRCLHTLLSRAGFPYKECDLNNRFDAQFLMQIKESLLHMDQDQSGAHEHLLQLKRPGQRIVNYAVTLGDEPVQATMCFFYPDMFGLKGKHLYKTHRRGRTDPEDQHDEEFLQMTQSKQEAAAKQNATKKKSKKSGAGVTVDEMTEEMELDDTGLMLLEDDEDTNDQVADMGEVGMGGGGAGTPSGTGAAGGQGAAPTTTTRAPKKWLIEEEDHVDLTGLVGVDQATLLSIDKCDNDEMKKRMYSTIVVVGGGLAKFDGAESWIKYAVWTQMPAQFRLALETMDVICSPKEIDPQVASWKGGAILSCLDTAQELWIRQKEWSKHGAKILRERAPFVW